MNLRVELVHLNSSGFQIYKFNINLFYKSNSGAEGNLGSNLQGWVVTIIERSRDSPIPYKLVTINKPACIYNLIVNL